MSKAAELAALIGSQTALSNRNHVINGEFQIWQRGTSQTTAGYGSADRWRLNVSGASLTGSQGTFTDGQTAVPGNPRFYLALDVATGNDNAGWFHRLEGTHEFANDVYTLSFWAKSATPRAMTVGANSFDSSTDTFDETHTTSPSTFTPTSSWQKFTFKVTFSNMNSLGSFASGDFTAFFITQGSSTSTAAWKLDLALVQFEKGEQATPFEHRSVGEELARCQRYFQNPINANNSAVSGGWRTSSQCQFGLPLATSMRASPTMTHKATTVHGLNGGTNDNGTGCNINNSGTIQTSIWTALTVAGTPGTSGEAVIVAGRNQTEDGIFLDAEL